MTLHRSIRRFLSREHLALEAAREFARLVGAVIEERGVCRVALAGGETPRLLYNCLAQPPFVDAVDWSKVHVFFGDERAVLPSDELSNYGMVDRELLSHLDIPRGNIHRIFGELSPEEAARRYQIELEEEFGDRDVRLDLVLLGLGEDGHTASLFPRTDAVSEEHLLVCPVYVPQLNSWRITLTLRVINSASNVLFLVTGEKKASILRDILTVQRAEHVLPAAMVMPRGGTLTWMIDNDAAAGLKDVSGLLPGTDEV